MEKNLFRQAFGRLINIRVFGYVRAKISYVADTTPSLFGACNSPSEKNNLKGLDYFIKISSQ